MKIDVFMTLFYKTRFNCTQPIQNSELYKLIRNDPNFSFILPYAYMLGIPFILGCNFWRFVGISQASMIKE